jgi:hypothetical protein
MPLKLNCGLSRKVGAANFGSRGASLNIELELDSGISAEPAKLQDRIRQLFGLVRTALAEELKGSGHASPAEQDNRPPKPASPEGNESYRNNGPRPVKSRRSTRLPAANLSTWVRSSRSAITSADQTTSRSSKQAR